MLTKQSQVALSLLNLLLAAVQTGFGPFVSVWLTERHWNQADIGLALSVGTIAGLVGQLPAAMLIDATSRKRLAAALALAGLGISALMLALWVSWLPVLSAEILHGRKRKPVPTVDGVGYQAALASTAILQFQGRSSLSLEAKCPRASWSMA